MGMEPEARHFLKKILYSLFAGLGWLMANMVAGIFFGLMIVEDHFTLGNIIYYIFLVGSFGILIRYYYKTWKHKFPHG